MLAQTGGRRPPESGGRLKEAVYFLPLLAMAMASRSVGAQITRALICVTMMYWAGLPGALAGWDLRR